VLDGVAAPLKGAQPPVFGSCLLWPNGWMDEDTTWCRSRPRPRPHCSWGPSSLRKGHSSAPPPLFSAHVCCGHGRPSQLLLSSCHGTMWNFHEFSTWNLVESRWCFHMFLATLHQNSTQFHTQTNRLIYSDLLHATHAHAAI